MSRNALLGLKKIFFDRIFQRSYWTWRKHPAIIVPSMLQSGLSLILQSVITLAVMLLLISDPANVQLGRLFASLVSPSSGLLGVLLRPAFWFTNLPLSVAVVAALVLVALLGGGWVYSSEYGMYLEAWNSESVPISSVVSNGSRRWRSMAWTLLLSNLVTWGPAAIGLGLREASLANLNSPAGVVALLTASYVFQPLFFSSLILSVFTVYSYPAVVVDGASGLGAVRRSFRVASHNLGLTLTYSIVRIIFQSLLLLATYLASGLGVALAAPFLAVTLSFLLTPLLHLTKSMIYYHAGQTVPEMPFQLSGSVWQDVIQKLPRAVWLKIRAGLREGLRYIVGPRNLPFHAASFAALAIGIYLGYNASVSGLGSSLLSLGAQPGHGNPIFRQFTAATPVVGVAIFLNNWFVSFATALSGLGFAAPSFISIMFTGFTLGVLVGPQLSPSFTMFSAAILPHGIIEIPSFLLAGSVGMRLGYAAFKTKFRPGLESDEYLSKSMRLAVYVVVGLAPLFFVAGLIEADITPFIMRMFGWTF
jgi:stage II sporulation protein M